MNRLLFCIFFILIISLNNLVSAKDFAFTQEEFFKNLEKNKVELYFVDPIKNKKPKNACENEACLSLLYLIENAKDSIDFAIYGIGGQDAIFNALVKAQKRGVKVRGVVDANQHNKNIYEDTDKLCKKINIKNDFLSPTKMQNPNNQKFKFDITKAIMHNKFFVVDNKYTWTGSTNISNTCLTYNANNVLVINSEEIAGWYKEEFIQMYEKELFHDMKKIISNNKEIKTDENLNISVFFLPKDNPVDKAIKPLIKNAKTNIDIEIFYLTHRAIIYELIEAHKRGVKIRVILDASSAANQFSKFHMLRANGIPVKIENWGGKMHMKTMIVDNEHLVIGSMNWTTSAQYHNDENIITIKNKRLAKNAQNNFNYLWGSIPDRWLHDIPQAEGIDSPNSCSDNIDNNHNNKKDKEEETCRLIPMKTYHRF